jgi:hypothetical protein
MGKFLKVAAFLLLGRVSGDAPTADGSACPQEANGVSLLQTGFTLRDTAGAPNSLFDPSGLSAASFGATAAFDVGSDSVPMPAHLNGVLYKPLPALTGQVAKPDLTALQLAGAENRAADPSQDESVRKSPAMSALDYSEIEPPTGVQQQLNDLEKEFRAQQEVREDLYRDEPADEPQRFLNLMSDAGGEDGIYDQATGDAQRAPMQKESPSMLEAPPRRQSRSPSFVARRTVAQAEYVPPRTEYVQPRIHAAVVQQRHAEFAAEESERIQEFQESVASALEQTAQMQSQAMENIQQQEAEFEAEELQRLRSFQSSLLDSPAALLSKRHHSAELDDTFVRVLGKARTGKGAPAGAGQGSSHRCHGSLWLSAVATALLAVSLW